MCLWCFVLMNDTPFYRGTWVLFLEPHSMHHQSTINHPINYDNKHSNNNHSKQVMHTFNTQSRSKKSHWVPLTSLIERASHMLERAGHFCTFCLLIFFLFERATQHSNEQPLAANFWLWLFLLPRTSTTHSHALPRSRHGFYTLSKVSNAPR